MKASIESEAPLNSSTRNYPAAALLAAIIESSHDAIVSKDLQGTVLSWNRGAQNLFGYTAAEMIGASITVLIPEDRQAEEQEILTRLRAGERVDHFETVRRRKDGALLDISLTISPIHDDHGAVVGASKIARDIGDRKQFEKRQALLLREMHHRVKNLFSLTGALVSLSAKSATSPQELALTLRERLMALAKAHELTLPSFALDEEPERTTTFFTLIKSLVSPYREAALSRASLQGSDFEISSKALTNIALLFHEFVTNSAKYGALSQTDGSIDISVLNSSELIEIRWCERGGPHVIPQTQSTGFGSQLEATVKQAMNADISKTWHPDGLAIVITMPANAL